MSERVRTYRVSGLVQRPGQRPGASIASVRSAAPGSSPPAADRGNDLWQQEAMAAWLVEYLVRAGSDGGRNGEAEGFGHHAIDDELVARRLLHRKIAGPGTPENAIDESGRALRDG